MATAFGHQAEILRGKTEHDELYKATQAVTDVFANGAITPMYAIIAIQSKFIL